MVDNNVIISRRIAIYNSEMNQLSKKGMLFCDLKRLKELKKERNKIESVLRKKGLGTKISEILSSINNKGNVDYKIVQRGLS